MYDLQRKKAPNEMVQNLADLKQYLDNRFSQTDADGIYFAHQPIYGFRKGHSEPGIIERYAITYQILKALSNLTFSSLLDVGGAEGYKAALIRKIFNVDVRSDDISEEACNRAKEIYGLASSPVDIHSLPYKDNSFDVVLCSETLEHVPDLVKATSELVRVCRKAVIITVPHEHENRIIENRKSQKLHAHIHSLNVDSFDFAETFRCKIVCRRFLNPFCRILAVLADGMERKNINAPGIILSLYHFSLPLIRFLCKERTVENIIKLDDYMANRTNGYEGLSFLLIKDKSGFNQQPEYCFSIRQIIDFSVPFHYLKKKDTKPR